MLSKESNRVSLASFVFSEHMGNDFDLTPNFPKLLSELMFHRMSIRVFVFLMMRQWTLKQKTSRFPNMVIDGIGCSFQSYGMDTPKTWCQQLFLGVV